MIKAVIFDYDDTLVQSRESLWQSHKTTAQRFYNITLSDADIAAVWGQPYEIMMGNLYKNADTFTNLNKNYMSIRSSTPMTPYPNSLETVDELIKNFTVGVLTAASRELIMMDLVNLNFPIDKCIAIQTADDTPVHKPNPDVFIPMLEKLAAANISPNEIVYIGDAMRDYQAAVGASLQFLGITHGSKDHEFITNNIPYVENFKQLHAHLLQSPHGEEIDRN